MVSDGDHWRAVAEDRLMTIIKLRNDIGMLKVVVIVLAAFHALRIIW